MATPSAGPTTKEAQVQQKVDNLKNHLVDNIKQLQERDDRLNQLRDGAEQLQVEASVFDKQAHHAKRAACWQLWRLRIAILAVIIIVIIIIVAIAVTQKNKKKK